MAISWEQVEAPVNPHVRSLQMFDSWGAPHLKSNRSWFLTSLCWSVASLQCLADSIYRYIYTIIYDYIICFYMFIFLHTHLYTVDLFTLAPINCNYRTTWTLWHHVGMQHVFSNICVSLGPYILKLRHKNLALTHQKHPKTRLKVDNFALSHPIKTHEMLFVGTSSHRNPLILMSSPSFPSRCLGHTGHTPRVSTDLTMVYWLVVWNIFCFSIYWE